MANEGYGNFESDAPVTKGRKPDEDKPAPKPAMPAAGPHARPDLINDAATPSSGALPESPAPDGEADPGSD